MLSFGSYEQVFGKESSENKKYNLFLQNFLLATKESKVLPYLNIRKLNIPFKVAPMPFPKLSLHLQGY